MAEEDVESHATADPNLDGIWISFVVQNGIISEEESRRVMNFLVQRDSLINYPTFVSEMLSLNFPPGSVDDELIQNISHLSISLSPGQRHMIVNISFQSESESESHNHDDMMNLELETVKVQDFEVVQNCAICLEVLARGSQVSRMPCSHLYHQDCIFSWLERNRSCPLCRYQITS